MSWLLQYRKSGIPVRYAVRPRMADPMNLFSQSMLSQMPDVSRDAQLHPRIADLLAQIMAGSHNLMPDLLYEHQGMHRRSPMRAFDEPGETGNLIDLYDRMANLGEDHPAIQAYTPGTTGYAHGNQASAHLLQHLFNQESNAPDYAAAYGWASPHGPPYVSGLHRALNNLQGMGHSNTFEEALGSGSLSHLLHLMQLPTGGGRTPMDDAARLIHLHERLLRPAIGAGMRARAGVFGGLMPNPAMYPGTSIPPEYVMPGMTGEPDEMMTRRGLGLGEGARHFG